MARRWMVPPTILKLHSQLLDHPTVSGVWSSTVGTPSMRYLVSLRQPLHIMSHQMVSTNFTVSETQYLKTINRESSFPVRLWSKRAFCRAIIPPQPVRNCKVLHSCPHLYATYCLSSYDGWPASNHSHEALHASLSPLLNFLTSLSGLSYEISERVQVKHPQRQRDKSTPLNGDHTHRTPS